MILIVSILNRLPVEKFLRDKRKIYKIFSIFINQLMKQLFSCVITIIVNTSVVKQHYLDLFNCLSLIEKNVSIFVRNVSLILNRRIVRAHESCVSGSCML